MKKIAFFSLLFFTQIAYAQFDYGVDVKKEEPKPPVYDGLSNIEANFHQITFDYIVITTKHQAEIKKQLKKMQLFRFLQTINHNQ